MQTVAIIFDFERVYLYLILITFQMWIFLYTSTAEMMSQLTENELATMLLIVEVIFPVKKTKMF